MIYFVRSIKTGHIKIGYTRNIRSRLCTLSTTFGKVGLLGIAEGDRLTERSIHRLFAQYRITEMGREWFRDVPSIRAYIAAEAAVPDRLPGPEPKYGHMACSKLRELVALYRRRTGEKLTGETIAKKAGLNVGTVSRWMQPIRMSNVDIDTARRLGSVVGVEWYELIEIVDGNPIDRRTS